jgi:hypothetical protein
MLLYFKLFGLGVNETLSVVLAADTPVGDVTAAIQHLRPQLQFKRFLFAGAELSDASRTLGPIALVLTRIHDS